MLKIVSVGLLIISSFAFSMSASQVQGASKNKLGCIKGLGVKRVEALVLYRKNHDIKSLEDVLNIRGIGKGILKNIEKDTQKNLCTSFDKSAKKKKKKNINAK